MYSSRNPRRGETKTKERMEQALQKMEKALAGTSKHLRVMGPVRSRHILGSLKEAFNKVKDAADHELELNQALKEEFQLQNRKISELEQQLNELQLQLRQEEERHKDHAGNLQSQIDEIHRDIQQQDAHVELLMRNIKDALEAAFALYNAYNFDEIVNDI